MARLYGKGRFPGHLKKKSTESAGILQMAPETRQHNFQSRRRHYSGKGPGNAFPRICKRAGNRGNRKEWRHLRLPPHRAHIAILMLYSTGLRQEELRTPHRRRHRFLPLREAKVTGKRSKQRVVPLPPELLDEIAEWQKSGDARYPSLPAPRPLLAGANGAISKKLCTTLSGTPFPDHRQCGKSACTAPHFRHIHAQRRRIA